MIERIIAVFRESSRSFEGQGKGEEVVLLLRKHPFIALVPVSTISFFALVPVLVFLIFYSAVVSSSYFGLILFLATVYYMALWLFAFYYLAMYTLNTVVVTNKRIIERTQNGFFDRQVSELHIYRIQDITVLVKGIIPTTLYYGDILVQTAASEKEFIFRQIPHPEEVKNAIMKAVSMANAGVKPASEAVNN